MMKQAMVVVLLVLAVVVGVTNAQEEAVTRLKDCILSPRATVTSRYRAEVGVRLCASLDDILSARCSAL
jgi:hypothetical protein